MTPSQLTDAERGLSGIARKVLEVVPRQDAWTVHQICSEMGRLGSRPDKHIVSGCLGSLTNDGLIKGLPDGRFVRVSAKTEAKVPSQAAPTTPGRTDSIEALMALADRVSVVAHEVADISKALADIAIDIDETTKRERSEVRRFRQLQELLKGA